MELTGNREALNELLSEKAKVSTKVIEHIEIVLQNI